MPSSKGIAKLKYRVTLCAQKDTFTQEGVLMKRAGIMPTWAYIEAKQGSSFSLFGAAVGDPQSVKTHIIGLRYRSDLDISNLAWIYEDRRKSGPRWYKVLSVAEKEYRSELWTVLDCRLVEKGNLAAEPASIRDGIAHYGSV